MSAFLTPLDLRRIEDTSHDGRGTWQLLDPLLYRSDLTGSTICVPEGFVTDLASVPRLPFVWYLVGGLGHAAAVVHDWLYSIQVIARETCDSVLYEALLVLGIPKWRADLIYMGVRLGGGMTWQLENQKQPPDIVKMFPDMFELRAA